MANYDFDPKPVEAHLEGIYDYTTLLETGINGFDRITDADVQSFHEQGFLVIHDAFSQEMTQASRQAINDLIMNPNFSGISFEQLAKDRIDSIPVEERPNYVRKIMHYVEYDERLKAMCDHPALLATMQRIIGHTPHMFQDMALIKPPRIGREKPWHQDMAYFNMPEETTVVGAWIALDEAVPENGCMMVIPGSHKQGPVIHFDRRDWQICDTDVRTNEIVAVPLKPGGCLLFHCLLHHGTPPSQSDKPRYAVQYHYKPTHIDISDDATRRLQIFGEEGKDVSC